METDLFRMKPGLPKYRIYFRLASKSDAFSLYLYNTIKLRISDMDENLNIWYIYFVRQLPDL